MTSPWPPLQNSFSPTEHLASEEPDDSSFALPPAKRRPIETHIEQQKLVLLKEMAAVAAQADHFTTFGKEVASEMRQSHKTERRHHDADL